MNVGRVRAFLQLEGDEAYHVDEETALVHVVAIQRCST